MSAIYRKMVSVSGSFPTTITLDETRGAKKIAAYISAPEGITYAMICSRTETEANANLPVPVNTLFELEFPEFGASLPCTLQINKSGTGSGNLVIAVLIEEFGGVPDPDYWNIIGVDENGNPEYYEAGA